MKRELRVIRDHGRQYIEDLRKQPVSERFRGLPVISDGLTPREIESVSAMCPVNAIDSKSGAIDLGRCTFCNECALMLPERIRFLNDYRIAANKRDDLIISPGRREPLRLDESAVRKDIRRMFKKALKLRQVSAGGDNSCEMELAATGNVNFDFGRYGVEFVASPRHADGIVITGPLTENMSRALNLHTGQCLHRK